MADWDDDDDEWGESAQQETVFQVQQENEWSGEDEDWGASEEEEDEESSEPTEKQIEAQKKKAEQDEARRLAEEEAKMVENMTPSEFKAWQKLRVERADNMLTDELFGTEVADPLARALAKMQLKDDKDAETFAVDIGNRLKTAEKEQILNFLGGLLNSCGQNISNAKFDELTDFLNEKIQDLKKKSEEETAGITAIPAATNEDLTHMYGKKKKKKKKKDFSKFDSTKNDMFDGAGLSAGLAAAEDGDSGWSGGGGGDGLDDFM